MTLVVPVLNVYVPMLFIPLPVVAPFMLHERLCTPQLSSVTGAVVLITAEHNPGSLYTEYDPGQLIVGSWLSVTTISNVHTEERPPGSVAV